jgi:hypothetical protein
MSLFPIFKVNHLTNKNIINEIIVFYDSSLSNIENLDTLFQTEPTNELFENVFNKVELKEIIEKNIKVVWINDTIHIDDNIGSIKIKIMKAFSNTFSLDEIYLFCIKEEYLNPITVYQSLTLNDKIPLSKIRFDQFLLNIRDVNSKPINYEFDLLNKEKYTFDDVLKLDLSNKPVLVSKILGQKIIMGTDEYPFIADPFQVNEYDVLLERSRKELSTMNNSLLLNTGKVYNNNIYLCLAQNVFSYCQEKQISSEDTSKIYYPFLFKKNISNVSSLLEKQQYLITESLTFITPNTIKNFENINMFYDIYQTKKNTDLFSLNKKDTGIQNIKVVIHPEYKVKIPIDVIFKLIHASLIVPLIKYNPSSRQENMYRLYANKLSLDGRKIPYLPKTVIYKLMKNIGKGKSVSVYTTLVFENTNYTFICEFEENGFINIYPLNEFDKVIFIDDNFEKLNTMISMVVNPLIDQIKPFFEQSGYKLNSFVSILHSNIEIRDLKLQTVYSITKNIDMNKMHGCISSVFTMESNNLKKGIEMRYKRVSNFNKHDSQEAFVIEKQKQGYSVDEIVEQLRSNYDDLSEEDAYEIIYKLINELQVTRGANKKRAIEIKINPGFKTVMTLNSIKSEISILVDNINDLYYLYTIPIYLDSFIRITQDIHSTKLNTNIIQKLCSGKELEDITFEEIIANPEQSFLENELPTIENDAIIYSDSNNNINDYEYDYDYEENEKMNELLDILGYSEENSNELEGGGIDTSSSSSVKSESLSQTTEDENSSSKIGSELEGDIDIEFSNIDLNKENEKEEEQQEEEKTPMSISSLAFEKEEPNQESDLSLNFEKLNIQPNDLYSNNNSNINIKIKSNLSDEKQEQEQEELEEIDQEELEEEEDLNKEKSISPELQIEEIIIPLQKNKKTKNKNNVTIEKQINDNIKNDNNVLNIEGLRLNNPYIFQEKLEEKDPNIFLTLREGKFDGYSRMCPSSTRRQPVILTKEEMKELAKQDENILLGNFKNDEYEGPDVIKYGSDPKKPFYYMCPRYWCLLTNKPLTEKQVQNGECGGKDAILPKNAKKVTKGKSIYQFYNEDQTRYPGFHKEHTPQGTCIPCCYDSWNKPAQISRRMKCKGDNKPEQEKEEIDNYIKGPEKFPLNNKRWGYLPFPIQVFFNQTSSDCQISKTNSNIKSFHTCLLRHGVENSETQSFVACIASVLFYGDKIEDTKNARITKFIPDANYEVPSISIMKQLILDAINIDKFITYQNGDLVTTFANDYLDTKIDETMYYNSEIYKKIQHSNMYTLDFFQKVVKAFENFKLFILNPTVLIDYTYLWDIICKPNPMLFENGINLVILEILNNDQTNNVELICPTNHYSNTFYDSNKKTLVLIKHDQYYEPIYFYRNEEKRIFIIKTFDEYDKSIPTSFQVILRKMIKNILNHKCKPFSSMSNIYKFKNPPLLDDLIIDLKNKNYQVNTQVLNFQGKVIGVLCKNNKGEDGFIPCYPSSLTSLKTKCNNKNVNINNKNIDNCDINSVYMTDKIWKSYDNTISFLKDYYQYKEPESNEFGKCIDGTDLCKVIEDKVIVGFLTKTNQFVQIDPPIPESDIEDNIRKINSNNYLIADIKTQMNTNVDLKRVDYIKRIELETQFYNIFRNTIRILLNDYINSDKRKIIQQLCDKKMVIYNTQLQEVIQLLKELCDGYIIFITKESGFEYNSFKELTSCISLSEEKCTSNPICMFTNDKCGIILPKNNLLSNKDNEEYYYGKMADELIRYNRIKSFIFKPQSYLSFGQLKYNLKEDEIIILQTLLNNEYFENLIPTEINEYAKYNTFDSAEPIISHLFSNEVKINDNNQVSESRDCVASKTNKITSKVWNHCFPSDYKEIEYNGTKNCGIYMMIDVIKQIKGQIISIEEIKDILLEEYKKYTNNFEKIFVDKIGDILIEEGKIEDGNKLKFGTINIMDLLVSDTYYFTNFDIWILLNKFEIASIFISSFHIPETRFTTNQFVCYPNNENSDYLFIVVSTQTTNIFPIFKIILNKNGKMDISLHELTEEECRRKIIHAIENHITVEDYIKVFKRNIRKKYNKKEKINKDIELEIVEENENIQIEEKPVKKIRAKKIKPTLVLEEEENKKEDILGESTPMELEIEVIKKPTKKQTTRKNKKQI